MESRTAEILSGLGLPIASVRDRITGLSGEQRQMIAIARAMVGRNRLMLVDDPSTLLSAAYRERFLALIQQWREEGIAVLFASDNLDHLTAVTDRITVLRVGCE
jgi:ABC-type sugar transport system ATPase subunit